MFHLPATLHTYRRPPRHEEKRKSTCDCRFPRCRIEGIVGAQLSKSGPLLGARILAYYIHRTYIDQQQQQQLDEKPQQLT